MASTERETGLTPDIAYNKDGLVPAIVQDADSGEVLMMAWMNDEAVRHTLATRKATFYSRSRGKIWVKGETSGHVQQVVQFLVDCDQDTVLLKVKSHGPACHVGYPTCFFREWPSEGEAMKVVQERAFDPQKVYRSK